MRNIIFFSDLAKAQACVDNDSISTGTYIQTGCFSQQDDHGGFIGVVTAEKHDIYPGEGSIKPVGKVVCPEMWGAIGNGIENDHNSLDKALKFASETGIRFEGISGSKYLIKDKEIIIERGVTGVYPDTKKSPNLVIDWNNSEVICEESYIRISGESRGPAGRREATLIGDFPRRGDSKLQLDVTISTDSAGNPDFKVEKGDLIHISSSATSQNSSRTYHTYVVSDIIDEWIYIEGTIVCDIHQDYDLEIFIYKLANPVHVRNGNFTISDELGKINALVINFSSEIIVDNMNFNGHARGHLHLTYYAFATVTRIKCFEFGFITGDTGYQSLPSHPGGLGYGYGILCGRAYSITVRDVIGGYGWHTIDCVKGQMHAVFENVICHRNGFGVDNHESSWYMKFRNCEFRGGAAAGVGRGTYVSFENCTFSNLHHNGIAFGSEMMELSIINCNWETENVDKSNATSANYSTTYKDPNPGVISEGYRRKFIFKGNIINGWQRNYLGFGGKEVEGDLIITDNTFLNIATNKIYAMSNTIIARNIHRGSSQFPFQIENITSNTDLLFQDNHHTGECHHPGSALFTLRGESPKSSKIVGNTSETQTIIRFLSEMELEYVMNNINYNGYIGVSYVGGSIKYLVKNVFKNPINDPCIDVNVEHFEDTTIQML